MSVTNKVRVGFAFPLIILAVVCGLSYWSAAQVPEASHWVAHTLEVLGTLRDFMANLSDLEYAQRSYILTGDPQYVEPYRTTETKLNQRMGELRRLTADNPNQQRRMGQLEDALVQRIGA